MRRLRQLMHTSLFYPCAICIGILIRAFASLGRPIARFPDTVGYETFHLFGSIDRFWSIPLVYAFITTDTARVALQVIIGALAWSWCALVLARITKYPRTVFIAILLMGLSPQVVRYDLAILSESLGISFAVLAITATVNIYQRRTPMAAIVWMISLAFCVFTRPTHLLILGVAVIVPTLKLLFSKTRQFNIRVLVLLVLLGFGILQLHANSSTSSLNFYTVLQERIVTSDSRFEWFSQHGMPVVDGMRDASGYDYAQQLPVEITRIISLPKGQQPPTLMRVGGITLAQWVRDNGWRTYAQFIASHPSDTFARITSLTNATLSPPNDDFLPLDNGPMIPRVIFGAWELWVVVGITAGFIVLARRRSDTSVLIACAVSTAGVYVLSMLTSGIEHPRHAVASAVALRLVSAVAIVYALPRSTRREELDESADARA